PAPGEQQTAARADIISSLRQKHRVAQCQRILDAAGLPRSDRGRRKRKPLAPGAGPALTAAHDLAEEADGSTGGERHVRYVLAPKVLRTGNCLAEPCRHG